MDLFINLFNNFAIPEVMKMKRDGKVRESTIVTQCCLVLDIIVMVLECTHVPTIYPLTVM
jgi:hypothetical protein